MSGKPHESSVCLWPWEALGEVCRYASPRPAPRSGHRWEDGCGLIALLSHWTGLAPEGLFSLSCLLPVDCAGLHCLLTAARYDRRGGDCLNYNPEVSQVSVSVSLSSSISLWCSPRGCPCPAVALADEAREEPSWGKARRSLHDKACISEPGRDVRFSCQLRSSCCFKWPFGKKDKRQGFIPGLFWHFLSHSPPCLCIPATGTWSQLL